MATATIKVELTKPHKHAGTEYSENCELDVSSADAKWLIEHQIAVLKTESNQDGT